MKPIEIRYGGCVTLNLNKFHGVFNSQELTEGKKYTH